MQTRCKLAPPSLVFGSLWVKQVHGALGSCWVGIGRRQEDSREEGRRTSASSGAWAWEVSFGRVVGVILGQVLWRVRALCGFHLLTWNFCRERDTAGRKPLFQDSLTSQGGVLHSSYPSGNGVNKR